MKFIESGSITSPKGFKATGVRAGIKQKGSDLALIYSETPAVCAGIFTTNSFQAAPVIVCSEHVASGTAQAVVANSGNANACTGERGIADARKMASFGAAALNLDEKDVLIASTGIIGRKMPMDKIEAGVNEAATKLNASGGASAAEAIMTTDTKPKSCSISTEIGGATVTIGGMAKGAGMICPNMATMLAFITTDAAISQTALQEALRKAANISFNSLTVDGDMSTNDTLLALANGAAENAEIGDSGDDLKAFQSALDEVCLWLTREIARDGEGATKFVEIHVNGAKSRADAHTVAKTIANSPLVKTAIFGQDPNWGRVLAAAGRSGINFAVEDVVLFFGDVKIVDKGEPTDISEEEARKPMLGNELDITLDLGMGQETATVFTCDMTYDYIRINAEYHT